jgi:hypothetical protein
MAVFVNHEQHEDPSNAIRLDNLPASMKFIIAGPKHEITAVIHPCLDTAIVSSVSTNCTGDMGKVVHPGR